MREVLLQELKRTLETEHAYQNTLHYQRIYNNSREEQIYTDLQKQQNLLYYKLQQSIQQELQQQNVQQTAQNNEKFRVCQPTHTQNISDSNYKNNCFEDLDSTFLQENIGFLVDTENDDTENDEEREFLFNNGKDVELGFLFE